MTQNTRNLRRINNAFGSDLKIQLVFQEKILDADVLNYNSMGVAFRLLEEAVPDGILVRVEVYYGSECIGSYLSPRILRRDGRDGVILFQDGEEHQHKARKTRFDVSEFQQGLVIGKDPVRSSETLYMRIVNISESGCRLKTSKSNRHLLPGSEFLNFDLMLPGVGLCQVSFKMTNAQVDGDALYLGVSWLPMSHQFKSSIKKYILMNLPKDAREQLRDEETKTIGVKNFQLGLKIGRVSTDEEYEEVLHLRFRSYQVAQKIKDGVTWEGMKDQYDPNSIIYTAHYGIQLVGTIRLCFSVNESHFPFEEYLQLEEVLPPDRNKIAEVSRLAVDPDFQGGDLFLALFQHIIVEIGAKKISYPVCLATNKLAPSYKSIGARTLSKAFPHPVTPGENLTLFLFDPEMIIDGKMNSLGWFKVARPALRQLYRYRFIRKPSAGYFKFLRFPYDAVKFLVDKKKQRKTKSRR